MSEPIIIPIQNASFESAAGWQFVAGSQITQSNGIPVVVAGYGAGFSQTLGMTPAQLQVLPPPNYYKEGIYTLKFSVANYFPTYPGYYEAKISFGAQELGEATGWGTASFTEVTMVFPSPSYLIVDRQVPGGGPVQGQQNLVITFTVNDGSANGGWQLLFKGPISLTFTPN